MPSFTLIGPKVIRFPFIIDSSYPHEILHNWWGNGVFPDPHSGNWSEGLTAYLADHLIQEQRGTASQYRRDILQKYTDYVSKEKDFPLSQFRSRHSSATEAIGYGKALMFFHMLRMQLGDEDFIEGLRVFYRDNKFEFASYDDIRKGLGTARDESLRRTFIQWVDRPGAPQLRISNPGVRKERDEYVVQMLLEQLQDGVPYRLNVPVAVTAHEQDQAYQTTVRMTEKRQEVEFTMRHAPLRIDVDPEFDVFRRLAREEIQRL
jgi:aminopeptidase N